jgi:putative endonuclease
MWCRKPKSVWVRGEDEATRFMKRSGCKVIARNLRLPMGEIDILCLERSSNTLVIVEVKARAYTPDSPKQIDPISAITQHKQAKLRSLAKALKRMPTYDSMPIRIDVVTVRFEQGAKRPTIKHYSGCVRDI